MYDYVFEGRWKFLSQEKPQNAKRVLLSNGDTVVIGCLSEQENIIHWIFDRSDLGGYTPIAWMDLPITSPLGKL